MVSLFSYLITIFVVFFWLFRIVVTFTTTMGIDFPVQPLNYTVEIILLFITLICIIFIIKRKLLGSLMYLISYGAYFGIDLYNTVTKLVNGEEVATKYLSIGISAIGMFLAFITFFDIGLNNTRKGSTSNLQTDWFYKNKEFDRQKDERADKNEYKL